MTLSNWTIRLTTAALLPLAIGIGAVLAAPSPAQIERPIVFDENFVPGADGVDYAAITGPRAPARGDAVPACADPARRGDLRPCQQ